jgi:hypothetical protein
MCSVYSKMTTVNDNFVSMIPQSQKFDTVGRPQYEFFLWITKVLHGRNALLLKLLCDWQIHTHRIMFWYANSYTFRASMAHNQRVYSCIKPNIQPFYHPSYVEISQFCLRIFIKLETLINLREFYMRGMLAGLDVSFYTKMHSFMMGHWGPKHLGVCILKHYCNSNEACTFVGQVVTIESKCQEWQM